MAKEAAVAVDDGDAIIIKRQFDNKTQAYIVIQDTLAPRGEQILRTVTVSFPKHWHVLETTANTDKSISIQLCSQD